MRKSVLAIGAHPDDIEIGCGGTLLSLVKKGYDIYLVIMTNGENWQCKTKNVRIVEQEEASRYLLANHTFYLNCRDGYMQKDPTVIDQLTEIIQEVDPQIIFTHYASDYHQDHQTTYQVTSASAKKRTLYLYESVTSQHFNPDTFYDISNEYDHKHHLIGLHHSQIVKYSQRDDSLYSRVRTYNARHGLEIGVEYAGGFVTERAQLDKLV